MHSVSGLIKPPIPEEKIVEETMHGIRIRDPFRYLEDANDPRTQRFVEEQNAWKGKSGEAGIPGPIGKVKNLTDVGRQLKIVDQSIDHIYREMASHITQLGQLHKQLDSLRETVRALVSKTEAMKQYELQKAS